LNPDLRTLLARGRDWLSLGQAADLARSLQNIYLTLLRIESLLARGNREGTQIVASIQDLQNAVAQQTTVEQSVLTFISGLRDQLQQAMQNNDQQAMQDVLDHLNANTQALSAAIVANTPEASGNGGGATGATGGTDTTGGATGATGGADTTGGTGATGPANP
jgi:hypothetical protein